MTVASEAGKVGRVSALAVRQWGKSTDPGVLLWPGVGFGSALYAGAAGMLPGRAVAVDPPGWGGSPRLAAPTYESVVQLAADAAVEFGCTGFVGHSLGAELALGVAGDPPRGLRAVVLVDGGYLDLATRARLGEPGTADREELLLWWLQSTRQFDGWPEAVRECAAMMGCEGSEQVEEALRQSFVEKDGAVVSAASAETVADLLAAFRGRDFAARARAVAVPTLLLASGQPPDDRVIREQAWTAMADRSALIELVVVEGWSHVPMLQQPEVFADVVGSWLAERL